MTEAWEKLWRYADRVLSSIITTPGAPCNRKGSASAATLLKNCARSRLRLATTSGAADVAGKSLRLNHEEAGLGSNVTALGRAARHKKLSARAGSHRSLDSDIVATSDAPNACLPHLGASRLHPAKGRHGIRSFAAHLNKGADPSGADGSQCQGDARGRRRIGTIIQPKSMNMCWLGALGPECRSDAQIVIALKSA